jgi:Mg2+ and Co2+ transporter CorA
VIDFVMEFESCGFQKAVRIINDQMGLGLLTVENMFQQDRRQKTQRQMDDIRRAMDAIIDKKTEFIHRDQVFLTKWLMHIEDKPVPDRTADEWVRIQLILEDMQYNDYLLDRLEEMRREVSEWRSKARSG